MGRHPWRGCAAGRATLLAAGLSLLLATPGRGQATAGAIHAQVPEAVKPDARYLFYLHGRIIETEGRRPVHPDFGVYEYDRILERFASAGLQVISEARSPDTKWMSYAQGVADQVGRLIDAGVPPGHVTVVGFSKGGAIAAATSWRVGHPDVRYVLLAACQQGVFRTEGLVLTGRVLSLYEAGDPLGVSCAPLHARSGALTDYREIRTEIGGGHGAFYRPVDAWVGPALEWSGASEAGVGARRGSQR